MKKVSTSASVKVFLAIEMELESTPVAIEMELDSTSVLDDDEAVLLNWC